MSCVKAKTVRRCVFTPAGTVTHHSDTCSYHPKDPKLEKYRYKAVPYFDELSIIIGDDVTTGEGGATGVEADKDMPPIEDIGRLWIHAASKVPDPTTIKAMENFYREIYALDGIKNLKFPEYYPLSRLIEKEPLSWSTRVHIALDSARGLEYIHEHTVPVYIHRDIKSANILIDKNYHGKVADFGLTKLTEVGSTSLLTRLVGTFGYMPPEYAQYGDVSPKVDVYAFGVVLT